ncbi:GntR family transcriptional regulator [Kineosporia mesophila]|uniref:GntR family transcriptional regulator n=1 Tax=Kineosporia mesophila TaxID=566012 RepID=A0ABP6ZNT1_9ACTN|nr:GntR family transcriptional regulator [Kineosporia mesophila]MCD5355113.1 GntR family transcriptional regulator [Kineosporia mesophila]
MAAASGFPDTVAPPLTWRKQDWAYHHLRDWILHGVLSPGQRIDQEGLATHLGISRIPLRQALGRLVSEGLVLDRPHHGSIVTPVSLADARDIYAGREALEMLLSRAAAGLATEVDVDEVADLLSQQEAAVDAGDFVTARQLDQRFHNRIYAAAAMPRTLDALAQLRTLSDRYLALYLSDPTRNRTSIQEHHAIVDALRRGDAEDIAQATGDHVRHGWQVLQVLLTEPDI